MHVLIARELFFHFQNMHISNIYFLLDLVDWQKKMGIHLCP